jgi:hypothetical protein
MMLVLHRALVAMAMPIAIVLLAAYARSAQAPHAATGDWVEWITRGAVVRQYQLDIPSSYTLSQLSPLVIKSSIIYRL